MFENAIADAGYAIRRLRARPAYVLLAVLTLALGIAGTASTYGVVRGVLFDALPYARQDDIGVFWKKTDWTEEEFLYIRGRVPGFQQVALYRRPDVILRHEGGAAQLVRAVHASSELFDVLGARPLFGRSFSEGDDVPGAEPIAILSFGLWQELGGAASVVGTRISIDGTPRTVAGVMPRGFWFPDPSVRMWIPEPLSPESRSWNSTLVGRVAPDHDLRAMDAPVRQLVSMLDERFDYPAQWDKTKDAAITPVADDFTGAVRPALLATLGAMALILLIACANVAALVLGQVDARSLELAVRSALGASRHRLAQSLVVEAMCISAAAGALGALLAWGVFGVIVRALPLGAWAETAAPDWRVFASAIGIASASTLLVVLVPAISLYRGDLRGVLSAMRTGGIRSRGGLMESGLVIAEVALAVMIAAGAVLIGRSVANLYAVDPGVRTDGVAVVDVMIGGRIPDERRRLILREVTAALGAMPGVRSAGAVQQFPLRGGGYNAPIRLDSRPDITGASTEYRIVTPGYLESVGMRLVSGRTIDARDRRDTERVTVINEALAQKFLPGVDPIGKVLKGDPEPGARVVGVVANAVERRLTDAAVPVRYVAVDQMPWVDPPQSLVLLAAPGVDPVSLLEPARRTLARVAPEVAVQQTTTMERVLEAAVGPARQVVVLLSLLTALALTLGAVGIYGVIAHFAARRRRDWAIRVALGLPGSRVVAQVVGHGALLVAAGVGAGAIGAALFARMLSSLLYGVAAIDPLSFAAAGAALLGVGTLAALVPAWRAGSVDPAIVLREQ